MPTPTDLKDMVKQQADIVRVVGEYVKLKKSGAQNYTGVCPFHQEKTGSFSVHVTRQFYHCFGCGVSGDVFSFVQKIENISFPEAIKVVAEKCGIKLPKFEYSSPQEAEQARHRGQLMEMHERACAFFEEQLRRPEAAHARQYLTNRGLSEETVREFRIGFAPDSGFLLRDKLKSDYSEALLRESGLFSAKEGAEAGNIYSKFRNRIMFPIAQENGRVIAFTGRTLATDEKAGPKYLNSPETPIYSKGRVLFNLDKAKETIRKEFAIIVEGQMDCISVYAAGFHNVIASSGTAFSEAQVRLLSRFTKNVVVNFDPDTAGATATDRSLGMLLEEEFHIKVLRLEAGFDPDLFIRTHGAAAYKKAVIEQSRDYFDYLLDRAMAMFPVRTPEGKKNAINYLLPHVHRVSNRVERDTLASDLAQKLGIDSSVLRQEFRTAATNRSAGAVRPGAEPLVTSSEKVLIRAASATSLEEREMRSTVLRALAEERLHEGLNSETLLQHLLEAGEEVDDPMSLPLEEPERKLLASVVMKEDEPLTPELLQGAVEGLRHRVQIYRREREIKSGIVEAEKRNDVTALLRLKQEKLELDRKLAAGLN